MISNLFFPISKFRSLEFYYIDGFCKFFSSIAANLKLKAFPITDCIWKYTPQHENRTGCVFSFRPVSIQQVTNHLRKLKRNKAVGLDNIPPGYLKDVAYVITKPLTRVINLSLNTGVVPNDFKLEGVIPIFKSGSANNTDNYRPISVLPILSKILEKMCS